MPDVSRRTIPTVALVLLLAAVAGVLVWFDTLVERALAPRELAPLAWQEGEEFSDGWRISGVLRHPEFVRLSLERGSQRSAVEIVVSRGTDDPWSTRLYRVQPAPGEDASRELLHEVQQALRTVESQPDHRPMVGEVSEFRAVPLINRDTQSFLGSNWFVALYFLLFAFGLLAGWRWLGSVWQPDAPRPQQATAPLWHRPVTWLTGRSLQAHDPRWVGVLLATLAISVTLKIYFMATMHGYEHGDEIFQYLEPPYRLLNGYGIMSLEYGRGARNWSLPLLFMVMMKGCYLLGIREPGTIIMVIRTFTAVAYYAGLLLLLRELVRRRGWFVATISSALLAPMPVFLAETNRTMSEPWALAALLASFGFYLSFQHQRATGHLLLAGLMLGLASLARAQCLLIAVPALFITLGQARDRRRRWLEGMVLFAGVTGVMSLGWLLDLISWGRFGHSFFAYLQLNLGDGAQYLRLMGFQPWDFFFQGMRAQFGWLILPMALLFLLFWLRNPTSLGCWAFALFLAVHSLIPHKEYRFLHPVLPMLVVGSLAGLERLLALLALRARLIARVGTVAALLFGVAAAHIGYVWDGKADIIGAVRKVVAENQDALCTVGLHPMQTGGYFWIAEDLPLHRAETLAEMGQRFAGASSGCTRAIVATQAWQEALEGDAADAWQLVERVERVVIVARNETAEQQQPRQPEPPTPSPR